MPIPDEDVGQECAKSEQKKEDKGEYTERLMENTENIIELRHLKKCYEPDKPVIEDFNLTIKKGEFVTFLGPSRLCHFIRNESSRNVVFISISGRFA